MRNPPKELTQRAADWCASYAKDESAIIARGWHLFRTQGGRAAYEIQRVDYYATGKPLFADDDAAIDFVIAQALRGSTTAQEAITIAHEAGDAIVRAKIPNLRSFEADLPPDCEQTWKVTLSLIVGTTTDSEPIAGSQEELKKKLADVIMTGLTAHLDHSSNDEFAETVIDAIEEIR